MHLMPGLAMFAHRHFTPTGLRGWRGAASAAAALARGQAPYVGSVPPLPPPASPAHLAASLIAAPLAFYLAWQALYFVVVQLLCRRLIVQHGYETSYSCLARRAAKTNNFWNRLVRRGSVARRLAMYGLLQLAYTLLTLLVFLPTYLSFPIAVLYQARCVICLVLCARSLCRFCACVWPSWHEREGASAGRASAGTTFDG